MDPVLNGPEGDENSHTYFIQRLSVSVQRGNTASVLEQSDNDTFL